MISTWSICLEGHVQWDEGEGLPLRGCKICGGSYYWPLTSLTLDEVLELLRLPTSFHAAKMPQGEALEKLCKPGEGSPTLDKFRASSDHTTLVSYLKS